MSKPDIYETNGRWKWMREVVGNETEIVEYYQDLARQNEWKLIPILNKDAFNAYIWISL